MLKNLTIKLKMYKWKMGIKVLTFVVPVTVTFLDEVGHVSKVVGVSMQPILNPKCDVHKNDYVYLRKWGLRTSMFYWGEPHEFHRGEIVTFTSPSNPKERHIKRIIALEGDAVRLKKDRETCIKIPENHCWVEGENSTQSLDSNTLGPISMSLINSTVTHVIWPPSRWQKLDTIELESDRVVRANKMNVVEIT